MDIVEMKENKDGSCSITFDFTTEELSLLLTYAVTKILEEEIEKYKLGSKQK